jgi:hypothetical protein
MLSQLPTVDATDFLKAASVITETGLYERADAFLADAVRTFLAAP